MQTPIQRIQTLPRNVAERIAAGEVIERPSSVVKELVENSIDAEASMIEVQLEDGGKKLIQVTDDGYGIHPDDLALSLERHATSKLKTLNDLESIATLGFRGEALPSIAAVSDLEILSRRRAPEESKTAEAFHVRVTDTYWTHRDPLKAKPVTFGQFLGRAHGTQIRAQSLFSQVPARQKFLKSNSSEASQVRDWLERLSLTHPTVGFRLVNDGKVLFQVRSENKSQEVNEKNRVHAILAGGEDFPIASRRSVLDSGIEVRAYWVQGMSLSHTRKLVQVVNGRAVRDRLLQQAILNPFKQALLPGQFPAVAVFLDLPLSSVDVNVHPTKSEVRFLDSSAVFRAVAETLEKLIREKGATGFLASTPASALNPKSSYSFSIPVMEPRQEDAFGGHATATSPWQETAQNPEQESVRNPEQSSASEKPKVAPNAAAEILSGRFRGTFFQTYIALEKGEELVWVDQHAADERIRYEKLKAKILDPKRAGKPQQLLIPEVVFCDPDKRARVNLLTTPGGLLTTLGFESEIFGDDRIIIRSMPSDWGNHSLKIRLKNLVERLLELSEVEIEEATSKTQRGLILDERLFEKIASEACRSSVMAGDELSQTSAQALIDSLKDCEHPWNCPHGRPTIVRVPKARLEEWFQRRV
ncbi:MAG: DNA mismatch repair endonuclease MutL [Bdellovibrionales bacterium]|nr:DNA mismatch repair endonuclease MutL [Bdellovibrionales bacterium]